MMSEEEWNNNFSHEIYSSSPGEEANFMAQLLGNNSSIPRDDQCWPHQHESTKNNHLTSIYSWGSLGEYNHFFSRGSSSASGFNDNASFHFHPYDDQVLEAENNAKSMHYYCCDNIETRSPEFNMMETTGDDFLLINQDLCYDSNMMESNEINDHADDHHIINNGHHEIKLHVRARAAHDQMVITVNNDNSDQSQSSGEGKLSNPSLDIYMKRLRDPIDINVPKDKRPLKNQKVASSSSDGHEEDDDKKIINTNCKRQNSMISCSSADEDDDSIAPPRCSSKRDTTIPNLNGKTRASRGSATDSQSLYARKRRERINERLKILQNLVPNGTKVDISTMLEEAVQYVKFLQLQIKLLSSDDLWMYSPIAYNGMDIGLDLKIANANNVKS